MSPSLSPPGRAETQQRINEDLNGRVALGARELRDGELRVCGSLQDSILRTVLAQGGGRAGSEGRRETEGREELSQQGAESLEVGFL